MSEIRAGDLVQIVKPKLCGCDESIGLLFAVVEVRGAASWGLCHTCGSPTFREGAMVAKHPDGAYAELWRLKKYDPPAEPERVMRVEELTA